jgi:hypothetical protein
MGVVSACAFSFMSKYLHQSCSPKPMTRVDINDNNQSSNTLFFIIDMYSSSMASFHACNLFSSSNEDGSTSWRNYVHGENP